LRGEPEGALGLYVHVPFCEAKCAYCHFAIDPRRPGEQRQERYLQAVLAEMEAERPGRADTLYFGGGTPSLMAIPRLARLVERARDRFRLPPGAEVTLEANPRDLEPAAYGELLALGVNRLSLGAQSFDGGVLRAMGRHHVVADSARAVDRARAAGFANVSIDVILGWPGESHERWRAGLDALLELEPDHVSLYVLEVEGRNLLAHRRLQGTLDLPDDDLVAELYRETVDHLGARGLERYEISNFARPGRASRHNLKYWSEAPFVGFGMSAHSFRGRRRWWNEDRYATYCRAVEKGHGAAAGERTLSDLELAQEALMTGLRRAGGVDLSAFRRRHRFDPMQRWKGPLAEVEEAGLVEVVSAHLRLTERGLLVSNEVFRIFV
jgi:oxygen-independent coproporphyrinogen-3 oxidase